MARQGWNEEDTYKVQDATAWGGYAGRANDPSGNGAAQDVNRYRNLGQAAANRQAYQNDWGKSDAYAGQAQGARFAQADAMMLQRQAATGQAPSAAQALGQNMLDQSLQAQMAGAASARGGSLAQAAAMRGAAQQAGGMQMQGMNQLAALRAQEMAQARDAYAGQTNAIRGQDFAAQGLAQQQQGMNMQSELNQRGLNQQAQMGYEQMGYNVNAAQQQAALQRYDIDSRVSQQEQERAARKNEKSDDRAWNVVGGVIGGLGGFFSDERAKMPVGLAGAPMGYAASRAGQEGDMFALPPEQVPIPSPDDGKVPVLAPGSEDWAKYGNPTAAEAKWAPPQAAASPAATTKGGSVGGGLTGFSKGILSDMSAKRPMMLSDMVGKTMYSDERAKMPSGVMGYEDGARIGADGLGYVERPEAESVVPAKFAAMQAAKESGGSGLAQAASKAKGGARQMTPDEMSAWADRELAKYRGENERLNRGEYKSAVSDAVERSRSPMADAARAMQSSAYAYKPGMEPPEQAPWEPNVGPMAQNMAANPVTATAVKKDPRSGLLMIDQSKMTKVLGGVVADQQKQIDQLSALVAKRGK